MAYIVETLFSREEGRQGEEKTEEEESEKEARVVAGLEKEGSDREDEPVPKGREKRERGRRTGHR